MVSGSQLQVAKLAQMCPAAPSSVLLPDEARSSPFKKKAEKSLNPASDHRLEGPKRPWDPSMSSYATSLSTVHFDEKMSSNLGI